MVLFINVLTQFISTNYMNDAVSDLTSYPFIIQIILLAVIPPVVEEFIFRGLIIIHTGKTESVEQHC